MTTEFQNKVVFITGSATGIGRATALAFASEGASLVLADTNMLEAEITLAECKKRGAKTILVKCDVANSQDQENALQETIKTFGRLDVAFNNAGIEGSPLPTAEQTLESWNKVIAVNLTGVWLGMKNQIPAMLKSGGGAIVNNASVLGLVGFAGAPAYTAAKHGVLGLTKAAALEYSAQGVRINAVCPGFIETPMLERAGLLKDPAVKASIVGRHAIGRMGRPEEVAEAVLWLASVKASFVAGHPLLVDGGYVSQ